MLLFILWKSFCRCLRRNCFFDPEVNFLNLNNRLSYKNHRHLERYFLYISTQYHICCHCILKIATFLIDLLICQLIQRRKIKNDRKIIAKMDIYVNLLFAVRSIISKIPINPYATTKVTWIQMSQNTIFCE